MCTKLVESFPTRRKALIAAIGASTKYWVKGLNTYVYVIYFFPFIKFTKKGHLNYCSKELQHMKLEKAKGVWILSEATV